MKFKKLNAEDVDKILDALQNAGDEELRDYFRRLYDALLVEGNKRITFEA